MFNMERKGYMVKKQTLLLIACIVWGIAGFNVLRIGILAYGEYTGVGNILLSVAVFVVFQKFIFGRLVKKHTVRIEGYGEECGRTWRWSFLGL